MTTVVRDFDGSSRTPTLLVPPEEQDAAIRSPTIQSPGIQSTLPPHSPGNLERQTSNLSSLSVPSSLRNRKPSRSNTVTVLHEPENPTEHENWQPGAEPGIDTSAEDDKIPPHLANLKTACDINIIDFSADNITRVKCDNESLKTCLDAERSDELPCRWISVNGLSWDVIKLLGNKYNLHRLAIEDLVHTKTRTKVDWYPDHAYVALTLQKLVMLHSHKGRSDKCDCAAGYSDDDSDTDEKFEARSRTSRSGFRKWVDFMSPQQEPDVLPRYLDRDRDGKVDEFVSAHSGTTEDTPIRAIRTLHRYDSAQIPEHTAWMEKHSVLSQEDFAVSVEQVSIFLLADNTVVSFFEQSAEDVEKPIFKRLYAPETMLRRREDASLLMQAIIDAMVDLAVPVKDAYNKARKELQIDAMTNPDIRTSRALHIFGEEVDMLQNLFKPIVQLVNSLRDHQSDPPTRVAAPDVVSQGQPVPANNGDGDSKSTKSQRDREGVPKTVRTMSDFLLKAKGPTRTAQSSSVSITPTAHIYFGDVLDHLITLLQALEQMDASAQNIVTLIFNTVSAKTNNFMMILAVVTVFFAPLTFISGYFGMNFASGAGLAHPFSFFWIVALPSLIAFMLLVFGFMLWDNIRDLLTRRGVKARWRMVPPRANGRTVARSHTGK